jgi:hypothetical protein
MGRKWSSATFNSKILPPPTQTGKFSGLKKRGGKVRFESLFYVGVNLTFKTQKTLYQAQTWHISCLPWSWSAVEVKVSYKRS